MRNFPSKTMSLDEVKKLTKIWRMKGDKIVFTNGCFDILHPGHIQYLKESALLGNRLIVGLNSDTSIKKLKGESRPILSQELRILQLEAIHYIDAIILFEEDTPLHLISSILPDILTKGGDYKPEEIVGYNEVVINGGSVYTLSYLKGYSSTDLAKK